MTTQNLYTVGDKTVTGFLRLHYTLDHSAITTISLKEARAAAWFFNRESFLDKSSHVRLRVDKTTNQVQAIAPAFETVELRGERVWLEYEPIVLERIMNLWEERDEGML